MYFLHSIQYNVSVKHHRKSYSSAHQWGCTSAHQVQRLSLKKFLAKNPKEVSSNMIIRINKNGFDHVVLWQLSTVPLWCRASTHLLLNTTEVETGEKVVANLWPDYHHQDGEGNGRYPESRPLLAGMIKHNWPPRKDSFSEVCACVVQVRILG